MKTYPLDSIFAYFPRSSVHRYQLLCDTFGTFSDAWQASNHHLFNVLGKSAWVQEFIQWKTHILVEPIFQELDRLSIKVLTRDDPSYPPLLREIHDPPICLFVKGELPQNIKMLSVVGSRNASTYGIRSLSSLLSPILSPNIAIISGLAKGIDQAAHRLALTHNSPTVAVLGSGLSSHVISPSSLPLIDEIIAARGAVISEFPPHHEATVYSFPKRNRIIAGMTEHTLVIEAAKKSGALITAAVARDEGRSVYTIPHPIDSLTGTGCHALINDGATLISHAEELAAIFQTTTSSVCRPMLHDPKEQTLYALLQKNPLSLQQIALQIPDNIGELLSRLSSLELKGYITKQADQRYIATRES